MWEDYADGYLSRQEITDILSEADFTLLEDDTDTKPAKVFYDRLVPEYKKKRMKLQVKKMLRPVLKTGRK